MSEKGAGYFTAAQRTEMSREQLRAEIEALRENFEITDEELQRLIDEV